MSLIALALYGSCARNDQDKDSDVDIFAISSDATYQMIVNNKLNIASYPESLALERASNGDLFILHVIEEGKAIYDPSGKLTELKLGFRYKENYQKEITNASDLGWMLVDLAPTVTNFTLLNRRIAWCVRTILIARSAEAKKPCFSANELCEFSKTAYVYALIKNKNINWLNENALKSFQDFLNTFGVNSQSSRGKADLSIYHDHFVTTGNVIGLKTISLLSNGSDDDSYF